MTNPKCTHPELWQSFEEMLPRCKDCGAIVIKAADGTVLNDQP